MIANEIEYQQALDELQALEQLLAEMRQESRPYRPDLELLGVRRLISRLHDELGQYEADATRPLREFETAQRSVPVTSQSAGNL